MQQILPLVGPSHQYKHIISCRLQVKPRLFWYRHHPKMHEMVSDRSSRAENLTDASQNFNARLFRFEKMWKTYHMVKKNVFREKKSLRSHTGHTKVVKNKHLDII